MNVIGYTEDGSIQIEIDGVNMTIPDDPANRHRQMIAEWEAAGNTIPPYVPEPIPLAPLSARQLRLGLVTNGIALSTVEGAIAEIEDAQGRAFAEIEWEYASEFHRDHHLIDQIGAVLDLTSEQIDDMWQSALAL